MNKSQRPSERYNAVKQSIPYGFLLNSFFLLHSKNVILFWLIFSLSIVFSSPLPQICQSDLFTSYLLTFFCHSIASIEWGKSSWRMSSSFHDEPILNLFQIFFDIILLVHFFACSWKTDGLKHIRCYVCYASIYLFFFSLLFTDVVSLSVTHIFPFLD